MIHLWISNKNLFQVLEILWDLPKQEVLQILEEFHKKSLIVKKYNATLKCNVYGIHDLLLYHLKNKMLDEEALEVCNDYFYLNIFKVLLGSNVCAGK